MKRALTSRDKAQVIRSAQLLVEMKEKNIVSKAAEEELQKKKTKTNKKKILGWEADRFLFKSRLCNLSAT